MQLFIFTNSLKKHLDLHWFQTGPKLDKEICMLNSPSRLKIRYIRYTRHLKPKAMGFSATFPESFLGMLWLLKPFGNLEPSRPASWSVRPCCIRGSSHHRWRNLELQGLLKQQPQLVAASMNRRMNHLPQHKGHNVAANCSSCGWGSHLHWRETWSFQLGHVDRG